MRKLIAGAGVILLLALVAYSYRATLLPLFFRPTVSEVATGTPAGGLAPQVIAEGLEIPWELAFLPDGDLLVTERPGRLLRIGEDRHVIEISGVVHRGEGGLLGLALHPSFKENGWMYLYLTTESSGRLTNRVERYTLDGTELGERAVIIEGIPGASNHDGGRLAFGPDGKLYITTGDAGVSSHAQDTKSLAGKILRVDDDGAIPADNPFGNAVYSYGHRNVQGIAWDDAGVLWATEHGRSGARSGFDELNKVEKGANYGWPAIEGDATREGMTGPQLHSGASDTWAPSGMAYLDGHVLFAGLRGESLYVAQIAGGSAGELKAYLRGEYGRLRTVALGPDGMLYLLTNNRDGRGAPGPGDDRILRLDPRTLGL